MTNESNIHSNVKQAVPFLMVRNMAASLDFYVKGIGFEITYKWLDNDKLRWCWLQLGGAALMLQEYATEGQHARKTPVSLGEGVSVYFICRDAIAIYLAITANGLSATEPFVGNNMWVTALNDPDGYKIFFESPTDVPEETTYYDWLNSNKAV